jgi:hypothetical protein
MSGRSKSLALRARVPMKTTRQAGDGYFQLDLINSELVEQFDEVVMRGKPACAELLPAVKRFLSDVDSFDETHSEEAQWPRRDLCDRRKDRQIAYKFVVDKILDLFEAFGNARPRASALKFLIGDVVSLNPAPIALETACKKYRHAHVFPPSAIGELLPFLVEEEERWIHHRDIIGGLGEKLEHNLLLLDYHHRTKQLEPPRMALPAPLLQPSESGSRE